MRDFIREKKERLQVDNLYVVDGTIEMLPFPDESFDIVMSGHVIGDDYDRDNREMERVTRVGGCIIDCPGEDDGKRLGGMRKEFSPEMVRLGFSYNHYVSKLGGDVYRYLEGEVSRTGLCYPCHFH